MSIQLVLETSYMDRIQIKANYSTWIDINIKYKDEIEKRKKKKLENEQYIHCRMTVLYTVHLDNP